MSTTADTVMIRDFVYLDTERVKSLLAQIEEGLLTDRTGTSGRTSTASGGAGVKIPAFLDLGGSGQYTWENRESETRTLHDYIYSQTESRLIEMERLIRLPQDFDSTQLSSEKIRDHITPVSYILARGKPVIQDYAWMTSLIADFNNILRHITLLPHLQDLRKLPGKERAARTQQLENQIKESQLDPKLVEGLKLILDRFCQDRLEIYISPFSDQSVKIVGPLQRSELRDSVESIRFKYGSAPDTEWSVFGQVAYVPQATSSQQASSSGMAVSMGDAFQQVFASLRGVEQYFSVGFPEIAITPIAVYRS